MPSLANKFSFPVVFESILLSKLSRTTLDSIIISRFKKWRSWWFIRIIYITTIFGTFVLYYPNVSTRVIFSLLPVLADAGKHYGISSWTLYLIYRCRMLSSDISSCSYLLQFSDCPFGFHAIYLRERPSVLTHYDYIIKFMNQNFSQQSFIPMGHSWI